MDLPTRSIGLSDLSDVGLVLPIAGDSLMYDGIGWTNAVAGGGGSSFSDATFNVFNDTDNTKILKIDCSTIDSMTTTTVNFPPVTSGEVLLATAPQDLQNKGIRDSNNNFYNTFDDSKQFHFDAGLITASSNIAVSIPDWTGTLVMTDNTATLSSKTMDTGTIYRDASFSYNLTMPTATADESIMTETAVQVVANKTLLSSNSYLDGTNTHIITTPNLTGADKFATLAGGQALTNKTITHPSNNVISRELWVNSGFGAVSTYASAVPTSGQVLQATSGTTATWQTLKKRRNYQYIIKDACNTNEVNYAPFTTDISPADFGSIYFGTAYKLVEFSVTILGKVSQTITAGTMTFDIGTVTAPYDAVNYSNVLQIGTLTSASGTNPIFYDGAISQAFGATDRIVIRQTTDGTFAISNTNSDLIIEAVFEEV